MTEYLFLISAPVEISLIDKEEDSLRFYYLGNNYQKKVEHYGVKIAYEAEGVLMI